MEHGYMRISTIDRNAFRALLAIGSGVVLSAAVMMAQTVPNGARIDVRTIDRIDVHDADGRVFAGSVDQNVVDTNGRVIIPRGTPAELEVHKVNGHDLTIDIDSVTLNGQRYAVQTTAINRNGKDGVGGNGRTGKYVGGGAVFGTILGAIAGGGRGAAIGALSGAAAGAGTQILTRGRAVKIPPETLLTFRMEQALTVGVADSGYDRDGHHYHRNDQNNQQYPPPAGQPYPLPPGPPPQQ